MVIAIIGILSGLIIVGMNNATNSANDAKRKANLDTIRKALLMYQANNGGTYPISATPCDIGSTCTTTEFNSLIANYLPNPPRDPSGATIYYKYTSANGTNFTVSTPAVSSQAVNSQYGTGIADIDGNFYNTVLIGTQTWMASNLMTIKYRDGSAITDGRLTSNWIASNDHYCYPPASGNIVEETLPNIILNNLGFVYQWDAVANSKGICPVGWHVPSDAEWYVLENYLKDSGQTCDANRVGVYDCFPTGAKISSFVLNGTNSSGFSAILAGQREIDGSFANRGVAFFPWSSTESSSNMAYDRLIGNSVATIRRSTNNKAQGFPVRCLKN